MKIGLFSDFYLPRTDGIAYSVETFRAELEKRGHEVYVFAPRPFPAPASSRHQDPDRIIRFPAVKGLFFDDYLTSFFFPPKAIHDIEKLNLEIIHYHTPSQIGLLGAYYALRHNLPLVTTYHTDLYEYVKHYPNVLPGTIALSLMAPVITGGGMDEYRAGLSSIKPERNIDKWNQKIVRRGITMIHNHCDQIIAPSRKIEQQLQHWHTTTPITVLPTGVDQLPTTPEQIAAVRAQYQIHQDDHVVLFVGRLGTEKNLSLLIRAFDIIVRRDPHARLVITGPGDADDVAAFKSQAAAGRCPERVTFTGPIPRVQLGAVYGMATVFAFPSLADTQGLTLNEAAAAGLPIVIIDPSVTEVVKDGQNGYVARNNQRDFAAKIVAILRDPTLQTQMSYHSRQLASRYSITGQTTKLLELYQTAALHHQQALTRLP